MHPYFVNRWCDINVHFYRYVSSIQHSPSNRFFLSLQKMAISLTKLNKLVEIMEHRYIFEVNGNSKTIRRCSGSVNVLLYKKTKSLSGVVSLVGLMNEINTNCGSGFRVDSFHRSKSIAKVRSLILDSTWQYLILVNNRSTLCHPKIIGSVSSQPIEIHAVLRELDYELLFSSLEVKFRTNNSGTTISQRYIYDWLLHKPQCIPRYSVHQRCNTGTGLSDRMMSRHVWM